jgi:hypothetical protein
MITKIIPEQKINLYQFDELSSEVQQKVINEKWDINLFDDWYQSIYDDAENIGLKITDFDIDRGNYCNGKLLSDHIVVALKIAQEHGEDCETTKTAKQFLSDCDELVGKYSDGKNTEVVTEENDEKYDTEADELEDEFLKSLLEDYKILLSKEYEYLTSREEIIATIKANEYYFTEEGKIELL